MKKRLQLESFSRSVHCYEFYSHLMYSSVKSGFNMEIPLASSTSVDNQTHQENSGGNSIKSEDSDPIPRN